MTTLCTIAIPVFNRASLVRHAIDSALAQDIDELEVLVVDNCSTDGTWETLQTYDDKRVRLARNSRNLGLVGNLNQCLTLARGRYLRLLCSDDRLVPGTLKREVELMEAHPTVAVLTGRNRLIYEGGHGEGMLKRHLQPGVYASTEAIYGILWLHAYYGRNPLNYISGIMLRRDAAMNAGLFDEELPLYLDLEFLLRVLQFGDLAIWNGIGAEVLIHPRQEGLRIGDAAALGDLFHIASRYRTLLEERGTYGRMREQFAGHSLGLSIYHLLHGKLDASRSHRDLQKRVGASWWAMGRGLTRIVAARMLQLLTGTLILPPRFRKSFRALNSSSAPGV